MLIFPGIFLSGMQIRVEVFVSGALSMNVEKCDSLVEANTPHATRHTPYAIIV